MEITWALLTPKDVTADSVIQNICLGALYSKPNSRKKSLTVDHIAETFNLMNVKYPKGLHWIIAGDSNDMKLDGILKISPNFKSVVTKPTRLNPDNILDNIITDLSSYYQEPECLPPLEADDGSGGVQSDHLIVLMKPINVLNNKSTRTTREVTVRPMKESGILLFGNWLQTQDWKEVFNAQTVDEKAEVFQKMLMQKVDEYLPEKIRKISSDDQPFVTDQIKRLKRKKGREFHKHRKSDKWQALDAQYRDLVKNTKKKYYHKMVQDLKGAVYLRLHERN